MKTINETNYVDKAEKAILSLRDKAEQQQRGRREPKIVTTSKIRNLLAMTADIYNQVMICQNDKLSDDLKGRIEYLRVRFMYECGREPLVKNFVKEADILPILKEINGSKKNYILFSRYMEALIAFHKYYDGKDW
ncbi:type III-A CRISPR-associated protein Csm2 [Coprococcus catus]|uniref:type III-A CRISPR-associated protein Csm2 n=1 Tax=Coprococcus catus TaxID=116085 RepID=UPI001C01C4B5|nr:type III-A CRISPR-associated protein Csm2 [Coprococcus catus]MBT9772801.1 type III-A CRISPR-associated protein Csm2 [Coprococcus catus]